MAIQNERFNVLIKAWVDSGIHKTETPEIDKLFKQLRKANKRTANKLLPMFNDKLEKLLKERNVI